MNKALVILVVALTVVSCGERAETWRVSELCFTASRSYASGGGDRVKMDVEFSSKTSGQTLTIPAFWDGEDRFVVRNYFYLIIDRDEKGEETVHFLNLVDERDLFALMEDDEKAAYESQLAAEQAYKPWNVYRTERKPIRESESSIPESPSEP